MFLDMKNLLRRACWIAGNLTELSRRVGVSRTTLYRILQERKTSQSTILKLQQFISCNEIGGRIKQ